MSNFKLENKEKIPIEINVLNFDIFTNMSSQSELTKKH